MQQFIMTLYLDDYGCLVLFVLSPVRTPAPAPAPSISVYFCSRALRSPCRSPGPAPAPVGYTWWHHATLVSWDAGDL